MIIEQFSSVRKFIPSLIIIINKIPLPSSEEINLISLNVICLNLNLSISYNINVRNRQTL